MKPVLSRAFEDMEFNNPLCYLTFPGFALGTGGIYMGLNLLQAFYLDESLSLESTLFTAFITVVGVLMAFMGVLLHLIVGLLRYKLNPYRISNS